ncbi:MAG: HAD family hydrolase [Phycisphaerales bacterium]|nr:HAD family hydrolase [Phycisphaerales bacterium]
MQATKKKIVCFDLGGVVVRIRRTYPELFAAAGIDEDRLAATDFDALAPAATALGRQHQRGEIAGEEYLERLASLCEGIASTDELARAHQSVIVAEYPGIAEEIVRLRSAGWITACLSNTNDLHWKDLLALPALQAMDARHASHLFGIEKPNKEIFRAFERALNAKPEDILLFDDLAENCAAALECGWNAVRIDHEGDTAAQVRLACSNGH